VCTVFAPYSLPFTISLHLPPSQLYQSSQAEPLLLSCSPILYIKKKKKKNDIFTSVRQLHREITCGASRYICIVARFGSSPLFLFFLP
jgi:hypothetical protein